FITIGNFQAFADLKHRVYLAVSSLFGFFKDRENRQTLCRIMHVFVAQGALAQEIADACSNLNSYVERRMDQPDYDRRLAAFNAVSTRESALTVDEWLPLLYNMIYYIRQDEEFGVLASSSADGLCKFIDATRSAWEDSSKDLFVEQLSKVVVPAIQSGMRESSETTRRENLRVLSYLASHLSVWHPVADLKSLAPSSDEGAEDTFFFNILSPAHSKQLQALHILVRENTAAELSSKNVSQIFIPLLEHFIFGREGGADDQGLGAQATSAIASLSLALEWPQFRVLLRRFISYLESKPELQKQIIRLLERVTDSLATAADQASNGSAEVDTTTSSESAAPRKCRLARTLPETRKLGDELINNLLPPMLDRLHEKDESTVSARVPVGIIVVKLLHLLPDEQANQKLPGVLTDICHILRSKAWEAREMARETLAKITAILGPSSFGFVVKELRGALARGYQLHVLSYTIHSLLLSVLPTCKQGDLDYCLGSLMAVIMDDIFGATGQEKDADEYTSQMKEVKSSKS
ncbi:MAG: UTP20 family protein, partial [Thaumarchaeota archaeon]|nr:UTP20 family protein [Nitrososphaerota archaeon]